MEIFKTHPILEKVTRQANKIIFLYHVPVKKFTYLSSSFEDIWGKSFEEVEESYSYILNSIKKEDRPFVKSMLSQFLTEAFHDAIEFTIELPDKTCKELCCNVSSIKNDVNEIEWIGGFVEDITSRKKFERSLFEYSTKKNSILEVLEHDLGGHLSLLRSVAVSFTQKNVIHNQEKLTAYAKSIQDLCKSSMDMISDLVNREIVESSNVPLRKTRVDVVDRIKSFFSIFKSSEELISKKFELESSSPEIYVELDDIKFMQVINNLVYNAIKFTKDEGSIKIKVDEKKNTILFSIEDDGIGIPSIYHTVIFDMHTPASRLGLRGEKTNGIGLSIVKKIVDLHQGKIWFRSTEGNGTTFFVELPKKMENK